MKSPNKALDRVAGLELTVRQRTTIVGLLALLIIGAALESVFFLLLAPLAQAVAADNATINRRMGPFDAEASATTLIWVLAFALTTLTIVRLVSLWLQTRLSTSVEMAERRRLFRAYLGATWELQAAEPPGRLQSIASFATAKADRLGLLTNSSRFVLNIAAMLAAAFLIAPLAALAIGILGTALYLGFRPIVAATRRAGAVFVERATEHNEEVAEVVAASADIRAFGADQSFSERLDRSSVTATMAKRRAGVLGGFVSPLYQAIGLSIAVAILGYASAADVDVPAIGAVVILLIRSLSYGQGLQSSIQKLAEFGPTVDALEQWHSTYVSNRIADGWRELTAVDVISFDDVSYSYGDSGEPALQAVSLDIRAGDHLGIAGPSGAGKTTMMQLLVSLRRPTTGNITINGDALHEFTDASLRRQISLVPQRTTLFRGTVHDNVTFFRPDISRSDVEVACKHAGVDVAINALDDGYDTMIGPSHRDLSGGQVQRIGIARALAGRPQLLVLDEPTSSLDTDSEALVTTTLQSLPPDVTVVIVAHRMSTLRHCSRILVLEDGRATAIGSADQVAEQSDFYRRAVESGTLDSN